MLKRIITALVSLIILLPILYLSNTYVFSVAIGIVTCISLYEMFACVGLKNKNAVTFPAYLFGAVLPTLCKLAGGIDAVLPSACAVMMIYMLYLMMLAVLGHERYSIKDISMCFMTAVYIIFGFTSIQLIKEMSSNDYLYLLVFVGAWITDIFAYFSGVLFGKHKLCEAVSPKKTIEGSLGGMIFCSLSFVVFGLIFLNVEPAVWKIVALAVTGLIISIVSQIGDLVMSLIKRHYGIKDFGKLFPGHGGMLDRFDSIIAVALTLFILISTVEIFNIELFAWSGK